MKRRPRKREAIIGGFSLVLAIALCLLVIRYRFYLDQMAHWGYVGLFLTNFFSSGTVVLPGLGMALTFTMGGVLSPVIVGVVAGFGEATGSIVAYLAGHGGHGLFRQVVEPSDRFAVLLERHGCKIVLFLAAIINPLYYPFSVCMGALRFGLLRFFLFTWGGRTVKSMALAYLGYFGLRSLLQSLGLSV